MALKYTRHGQTKPPTDDNETVREENKKLDNESQEIKNKEWIDNFLGRTQNGQAKNLLFPSRGR